MVDKLYSSTHSLPLSQAPPFNFYPLGNHAIAPYPNNGFISSSTELITGQYTSATVDASITRDQGQSIPQSSQQQSVLSAPTMQLPALNLNGFNPSHVPIASESLRSTNPAGTIRAITAAGSIHLCHNHYNLIQSFANFKYAYPPALSIPLSPHLPPILALHTTFRRTSLQPFNIGLTLVPQVISQLPYQHYRMHHLQRYISRRPYKPIFNHRQYPGGQTRSCRQF